MKDILKKIAYLVVAVILCASIINPSLGTGFFTKTDIKEVTFTEFQKMVENDEIKQVDLDVAATTFTFMDKEENIYKTENPRNEGFKRELMDSGINVVEFQPVDFSVWDFLSLGLNAVTLYVIFKFTSAQFSNKNKDTQIKQYPDVKLDDVIGPEEMKDDIHTLIRYMKHPEDFTKHGVKMPKGVIFYGEPGTGKTLLAKAIAGEAQVPFYSRSGSDFVELFAGNGARKVRELFKEARKNKPCIIFIDEIDSVGKKRGTDMNGERDQTMNQLLAELDGFETDTGILLIAATNRLEDLDPALIRSGRFDKHIHVPLPMTKEDRVKIIRLHSKNLTLAEDVNIDKIAQMTIGLSGADIQSILNEAALITVSNHLDAVTQDAIDEAFTKKIIQGHSNKGANLEKDQEELKLIAYHEAGHAIISKLLNKKSVPMISIVGTTTGMGGFTISMPEKMGIMRKEDLEKEVMQLYGGRVAEEIMGYGMTTGASNDIMRATNIISGMVSTYGFNENGSLLSYNGEYDVSEQTKLMLDTKAEEISIALHKATTDFILAHKDDLIKLANELLVKETLEEKEINQILEASC